MSASKWMTVVAIAACAAVFAAADDDPWLWLEEIEGERALAWVEGQNQRTLDALSGAPEYRAIHDRALAILDSDDRIPYPSIHGSEVFNFRQSKEHPRGVWRRTTLESYRSSDPSWEILLDVDALAEADGTPWVFKGVDCLPPEYRRCIVQLSPGGGDAVTLREFDLLARSWVENGFTTPVAKTFYSWRDADTLWIGTDFGDGTLTASGYPRQVRRWTRGTELADAPVVFEAAVEDVLALGQSFFTPDGRYDIVARMQDFFHVEAFLVLDDRLVRLDLPLDAEGQGIFGDRFLMSLRSPWEVAGTTYPVGSLLAVGIDGLLRGRPAPEVLFEPTDTAFLDDVLVTRDRVVMTTLENVRCRLYRLSLSDGGWTREPIELPGLGTVAIGGSRFESRFIFNYQDFVTPPSLFLFDGGEAEKLRSEPNRFDASGIRVSQRHATSADGTRIPYFLVLPRGFEPDGSTPTLVTGYGGFEHNELPTYDGVLGAAWLERGGAYALANLRGGGEFGPEWHRAALRENRIKWIEDFIAVADDLVAGGTTSRDHLGIMGGSNSGLLVGAAITLRPDLCGAVLCSVPLLDMSRYHRLLAGASWMSEYGNPDDPDDWAYMKTWSPYHIVSADADYPPILFWANHRDDRVHPGHARKMAAKMGKMGHPVLYYEHLEGGHGAGSVNSQKAAMGALEFSFLWQELR